MLLNAQVTLHRIENHLSGRAIWLNAFNSEVRLGWAQPLWRGRVRRHVYETLGHIDHITNDCWFSSTSLDNLRRVILLLGVHHVQVVPNESGMCLGIHFTSMKEF
jgi:hypothetical protein